MNQIENDGYLIQYDYTRWGMLIQISHIYPIRLYIEFIYIIVSAPFPDRPEHFASFARSVAAFAASTKPFAGLAMQAWQPVDHFVALLRADA